MNLAQHCEIRIPEYESKLTGLHKFGYSILRSSDKSRRLKHPNFGMVLADGMARGSRLRSSLTYS